MRAADRPGYLAWATEAFRLTTGGVRPGTQIHTHMCYSEFNDIIDSIDAMDADVISIENSRSNEELLRAFTDYDAAFLNGWVHAQDRLFHMDENRRTASGVLVRSVTAMVAWVAPTSAARWITVSTPRSAWRTTRSPSFSSRLISTVKWRMSSKVRSRGTA